MNGWEMMLEVLTYYPGRPMGAVCADLIGRLDARPILCGKVLVYGRA